MLTGPGGSSPYETYEARVGRLQVQGRPGLQSEFNANLGNIVQPYLKIKVKLQLRAQFSGGACASHVRGSRSQTELLQSTEIWVLKAHHTTNQTQGHSIFLGRKSHLIKSWPRCLNKICSEANSLDKSVWPCSLQKQLILACGKQVMGVNINPSAGQTSVFWLKTFCAQWVYPCAFLQPRPQNCPSE